MPRMYPPPAFNVNGNRQWAYGYDADRAFTFTVQAGTLAHDSHDYAHMPTLCDYSLSWPMHIALTGFGQTPILTVERYGSRYDGTGHLVSDHSTVIVHVADPSNAAHDGYFLYHNGHSDFEAAALFY